MIFYFQMTDLQAKIEGLYGKAKVNMSTGQTLLLEPGEMCFNFRLWLECKKNNYLNQILIRIQNLI